MKHLTQLFFILLIAAPTLVEAQRTTTTYESLLQRSDQPSSYISHVILPDENGDATVGVMFRLDYDLVPFLRVRSSTQGAPEGAEYFAPVQLGLEIFEGTHRTSRRSSSSDTRSHFRDSYQDTIFVNSFEETRSRLDHIQGVLTTTLSPGPYNYELQLRRAQSTREQSSTRRNIQVPQYDTLSNAGLLLLSEFQQNENEASGEFLNYGENVLYGSDYELLVILPKSGSSSYNVSIHRMRSGTSAEVMSDATFETTLSEDQIFKGSGYTIGKGDNGVKFSMEMGDEGTRFGIISVPNSQFANARFRIQVKDENDKVLASRVVNSRWLDMPVSLLNVDVAINMLRFIVSDSELRRMQSGSTADKERRFREFWEQRDPTPETEFNELMAEYYQRIDEAFRKFTTIQNPGYETDQGRAYILYGEPDNVERRLPTDRPTQEVWQYPNRTLVFEATTGFGDFRLVSER